MLRRQLKRLCIRLDVSDVVNAVVAVVADGGRGCRSSRRGASRDDIASSRGLPNRTLKLRSIRSWPIAAKASTEPEYRAMLESASCSSLRMWCSDFRNKSSPRARSRRTRSVLGRDASQKTPLRHTYSAVRTWYYATFANSVKRVPRAVRSAAFAAHQIT
jgi:hypothetical protein